MAVLDIVIWPDPVLETPAKEVEVFDDDLRNFVADMHETMKHAQGIGLAANQVGDLRRVLVIEIPYDGERYEQDTEVKKEWHNKAFTFINPKIIKRGGKIKFQEGCLSFPEIFETIERANEITVEAFDENGKKFTVEADDIFAVCLQHEIDHIDGKVFISRMSRLKSGLVRKKLAKLGNIKEIEAVK